MAIIAHVDHGKTTLVDALLKQSHVFSAHEQVGELILDSNDLEREKGITILAKTTSVRYKGVKLNIIDTPGHADFGGEVERVLGMADGCLLLVDAAEGPMPQTRVVLRQALALGLQPIIVVNKIDRANARPAETVEATHDLLLEFAREAWQLDAPILYTDAREGTATADLTRAGVTLEPLLDAILEHVPAPLADPDGPLQMLVSNLDHDNWSGRLALGRIQRGTVHPGQSVVCCTATGSGKIERIATVLTVEALQRLSVESAAAGEIVYLSGLQSVAIGDTIADAEAPEALPRLEIGEPTLRMQFSVNQSPLAGRESTVSSTSRQLRARLERELLTNVALRVEDGPTADIFDVSGRGELHLSILIETMRREGYEFEVSRPGGHHQGGRRTQCRAGRGLRDRLLRGCRRRHHRCARFTRREDDSDAHRRGRRRPADVPRADTSADRPAQPDPDADARHRCHGHAPPRMGAHVVAADDDADGCAHRKPARHGGGVRPGDAAGTGPAADRARDRRL